MAKMENFDPVASYQLNVKGRDWVVGDIHGSFRMVERALKLVQFDPGIDRIFALGDMVDRGRESPRVLSFLEKAHSIRGNHEEMFLDMYRDGAPPDEAVRLHTAGHRIGARWWRNRSEEERESLLRAFRMLPLAIEIETVRGKVGLVHAEVPRGMHWETFKAGLRARDRGVTVQALWGKTRLSAMDDTGVQGIARVFSGHAVQMDGPGCLGNVYYLDTGAVFRDRSVSGSCRLTMVDAAVSHVGLAPRPPSHGDIDIRRAERWRD